MKAAVVVANEDVQYQEIEEPQAKPGWVKIKVKASGICGSDVPRVLNHGVHFYPIVLGHEFSGDVVEVGEGVTKVKVGDRVSGAPLLPCMKCDDCQKGNFSLCKHYSFIGSRQQGSNADYVVVPEQNAVPFDKTVPYEQGAMFEPATVARLVKDVDNIVGIKEASGNISQVAKIMNLTDGNVDLYSGNDDQVLPILSLGGKGVISVWSNVAPKQVHDTVQSFMDGDIAKATKMQLEAIDLIGALFSEVNPIPVKAAMSILGYKAGPMRAPLTECSDEHKEGLKKAMKEYGIL